MTARGAAFVFRLAFVYCLLDEKQFRTGIGPDHLHAAKAVWQYSLDSAYSLFQTVSGTPLGDRLLALLANGPMKRNQFTDHLAKPSGVIVGELNRLEAAGLVRKTFLKPVGAGRPAETWEIASAAANN